MPASAAAPVVELAGAAAARAGLVHAQGLVMIGAVDCRPCDLLWRALQDDQFADVRKFSVKLSIRNREDCAFLREHRIVALPTILHLEEGVEVERLSGFPQSQDRGAFIEGLQALAEASRRRKAVEARR